MIELDETKKLNIESAEDKKFLLMDTNQIKKFQIFTKPRKTYWRFNTENEFKEADFKYEKFGIMLKSLNPKDCVIYDLITNCYLLYIQLSNLDPFAKEEQDENNSSYT